MTFEISGVVCRLGNLDYDIYLIHIFMFIFFRVKENEPKENARKTRPCGLPCASRKGRAQHNSLRSNKYFALS